MRTTDLGRFKDLSEEARGFIAGSDPESARTQLILELAESLEEAVQWIEDDIVNIKEYAPKHLNERVEEYRKRTHRAEEKLDDILEVLQEYTHTPLNGRVPTLALLQIGLIVKRGTNG